jgi:hypothetical protein
LRRGFLAVFAARNDIFAQRVDLHSVVTLSQLVLYFLRLGALGFGGPVALANSMRRDLVEARGGSRRMNTKMARNELWDWQRYRVGPLLWGERTTGHVAEIVPE